MTNLQDIKNRLNNGQKLIEELIQKEKDREALYQEVLGVSFEVDENKIVKDFYGKIAEDLDKIQNNALRKIYGWNNIFSGLNWPI